MTLLSYPKPPGSQFPVRITSFSKRCKLWEMAIKSSLGKLSLSRPLERFVLDQITENGFLLLNIELRHAAKVESLPYHHRDPFDRLLISQAISDGLTLVTADSMFSLYDVKLIW